MVGPLAALRQGADARQPPADQLQVERGDGQAGEDARDRLPAARQRALEHDRPAQREREVDRHRGGQERQRAVLAGKQQRPGGARAVEHVLAAGERDRRRGQAAGDGAGQTRRERIGAHGVERRERN